MLLLSLAVVAGLGFVRGNPAAILASLKLRQLLTVLPRESYDRMTALMAAQARVLVEPAALREAP